MPDLSTATLNERHLLTLDPRREVVRARLSERTERGGYAIPDTEVVRAIRAFDARHLTAPRDLLFEILQRRCMPMFRRMAQGLRHRPEWVEDAIADMTVQLWKEVLDPKETFMVQNFGCYLKRLAVDQFKHTLRTEGHLYRTNEQGHVTGRPEHVPAALVDSLDRAAGADDEATATADTIADAKNGIEDRLAELEAERILHFVRDPLDRKIAMLRILYHQKWDEIAAACGMSERTMRTRFETARAQMATGLGGHAAPPDGDDPAEKATTQSARPAKGRTKRKD
jgi:RNA polymerase sigma factor (sigma-70 family)